MAEIIVALDLPAGAEALALLDRLPEARWVKVGSILMTREGPPLVRALVGRGLRVFLDLKWHDIPNTVAGAVSSARTLGVSMATVHVLGGKAMLEAAVAASAGELALVGVTVLTSLDHAALHEIGIDLDSGRHVLKLAALARDCGLDGIVCSAIEAPSMRAAFGPGFALVTPGIRPAGSAKDDQARITTPEAAARAGADYLVIGRPITGAPDPVAALAEINRTLGHPA